MFFNTCPVSTYQQGIAPSVALADRNEQVLVVARSVVSQVELEEDNSGDQFVEVGRINIHGNRLFFDDSTVKDLAGEQNMVAQFEETEVATLERFRSPYQLRLIPQLFHWRTVLAVPHIPKYTVPHIPKYKVCYCLVGDTTTEICSLDQCRRSMVV